MLASVLLAACGLGCWPQHQVSYRPPEAQTPEQRNFEVVWQAARDALEAHDFVIDRQDRRAGVMTTEALVGQHFFEFWRKDASTAYSYGENSVQTIFRAAKVTIHPVKDSDEFGFSVKVAVARSDSAPRQLTDASQAMSVHGGVDDTRRERYAPRVNALLKYDDLLAPANPDVPPRAPLVPLGFDRRLEEVITHEVRVAAAGYVHAVPDPVRYTDPGAIIPTGPEPPRTSQGPNPAMPEAPPPMPNPASSDDGETVDVRLVPPAEQPVPLEDATVAPDGPVP